MVLFQFIFRLYYIFMVIPIVQFLLLSVLRSCIFLVLLFQYAIYIVPLCSTGTSDFFRASWRTSSLFLQKFSFDFICISSEIKRFYLNIVDKRKYQTQWRKKKTCKHVKADSIHSVILDILSQLVVFPQQFSGTFRTCQVSILLP